MIKYAIAGLLCVASVALAEDKSQFNLFNPTPRDQMRELNTDRPDRTEGPYTVDAGHVQLELDLASYSYDRRNPQHEARRGQTLRILPTNFRIGLLDQLEVDLVSDNFFWVREEELRFGTAEEKSGAVG